MRQTLQKRIVLDGSDFSPLSIPGLQLWLDATNMGAFADGDPVGTWPDRSGLGSRDAIQATTSKKPVYKTNIQNGKSIVRFDGVDDSMQVASIGLNTFISIFVAGVFTNAKPMFIEQGVNVSAADGLFFYGTDNNTWQYRRTSLHLGQGVTNWMGASFASVSSHYNGAGTYYKNGVLQANGTVTGIALANTLVTAALNICSRNQASLFSQGDLGEVIIYSGADQVSTADRLRVEAYLKTKWGTP